MAPAEESPVGRQASDLVANVYRRGQLFISEQESHIATDTFKRIAAALLKA